MSKNKPLLEGIIDHSVHSKLSNNQHIGGIITGKDSINDCHNNVSNVLCEQSNSESRSGLDLNKDRIDSDKSDDYDGGNECMLGVVIVENAGFDAVNGVYKSSKKFDDVPIFTKTSIQNGQHTEFTMYRCVLSNGTRRWYISVIPQNQKPGTYRDIDYYFCPANDHANEVPHAIWWQTVRGRGKAVDPPPNVEWKNQISTDDNNLSSI